MKTNRLPLLMTFASVFLVGTSLYAQQEVDRSWYPCPGPESDNVATPPQAAKAVNQTKTVSGLPEQQPGEHRATRLVSRQAGSRIASDHGITIST